jgi:hypothetical protein
MHQIMKRILILLLLGLPLAMKGQPVVHDYLVIKISTVATVMVVSTNAGPREIPAPDREKGEASMVVRNEQAYHEVIAGLIQEYEALGWTLFEVDDGRWVMRKPKQ